MKKIILLVLSIFCFPVSASDQTEAFDVCGTESKAAELIMGFRQANKSMAFIMRLTKETNVKNKQIYQAIEHDYITIEEDWVILAYEEPLELTEEKKRNAVIEFGNKIYLECIKNR